VSKLPQSRASNRIFTVWKGTSADRNRREKKYTGQLGFSLRVERRCGGGRADRGPSPYENVGVPFSDVSFRAFTASPNVEKETPTDQPFDNRSIA